MSTSSLSHPINIEVAYTANKLYALNRPVNNVSTSNSQYQPAMWFMDVVKFTQEPGGGYSHKGTLNFDVVGVHNSNIKAPFDCKVVAIYKSWAEGNTVVIESLAPVQYADGTVDYMCMSFAHDNDVSNLWVGKTIAQGEVFYQTGNYGNVTGVHAHVSCIRGTYQKDIWKRQPPNNNCASPNSICPTKALFLPEGIAIYETKGLMFQTYKTHTCTYFTALGVCEECGKNFELKHRTALNKKFTALQGEGTIHTSPYDSASVSGNLQKNKTYTVTESAVNSFANMWYKLEGTDSNGCEQWVQSGYLKEVVVVVEKQENTPVSTAYEAAKNIPSLTGNQAEDVAQIALSQVGYRKNKGTVYGAWWTQVTNWGTDYTYSDWCAMFACWCADQAGAGVNVAFNTSSARVINLFNFISKHGSSDTTFQTEPRPGDFIFFKNGNANLTLPHVAVIVDYNSATKEITYVGGNQYLNASCNSAVTVGYCKWEYGAIPKGEKNLYVYGYARPAYKNSQIPSVPVVNTSTINVQATGAGNITTTNATVYGTASYTGARPSEVGLLFGESESSLQWVAGEKINFSKNPFDIWYDLNKEAKVTLSPGKTYYYQLYAVVNGQYSYSNIVSFTTQATVSVWTTGVTDVTATNAVVRGSVQYTGNRPTKVGLLFGTNPADLKDVASDTINFSKNPFDIWYDLNQEAYTWLSSGQTYYYQFYVVQDGNYTYSNIASFQN